MGPLRGQFSAEPIQRIKNDNGDQLLEFVHRLQNIAAKLSPKTTGRNEYIQGVYNNDEINVTAEDSTSDIVEGYYASRFQSGFFTQNETSQTELKEILSSDLRDMQSGFISAVAKGQIPAGETQSLAKDLADLNERYLLLRQAAVRPADLEKFTRVAARVFTPEAFYGEQNRPGAAPATQDL